MYGCGGGDVGGGDGDDDDDDDDDEWMNEWMNQPTASTIPRALFDESLILSKRQLRSV